MQLRRIELFDLAGHLVYSVMQESQEVDLNARSAGAYLLRITRLTDGSVSLAKVIIQQ